MAFRENFWKWRTTVVGVFNIAAKRTLESLVRHEEILGSESFCPLCSSLWKRKALKSPGLGSLWPARNTHEHIFEEAGSMHVYVLRYICFEGIHAAAKLLSILVGDIVYRSQSLMKLQLYQHYKMPAFQDFSQSN